jgi:hypothetical protein
MDLERKNCFLILDTKCRDAISTFPVFRRFKKNLFYLPYSFYSYLECSVEVIVDDDHRTDGWFESIRGLSVHRHTKEETFLGYKKLLKRVYVHDGAHKKLGITHLSWAAHVAST